MLDAISVLDGRYANKVADYASVVSGAALIRARIQVEVALIETLADYQLIRSLTSSEKEFLTTLHNAERSLIEKVKEIEKTTRHDVKAVELAIKEELPESMSDLVEMIHFGVTSEDINNLAYRIQLRNSLALLRKDHQVLLERLYQSSREYKAAPMLARTHGQAAVPTTLGHEFLVFGSRLAKALGKLDQINLAGKLNGAVGGYNSFAAAFPQIDWPDFSKTLLERLGFQEVNLLTTQINTAEDITEILQTLQRINLIILDFDQDMWRYISDGWFIQRIKEGEVGSSVMSHKVNPIDFEGSEGNISIANSLIEGLVRKLPVSRLQRDLSDSTTIRNLGAIIAYSAIAARGSVIGLDRASPDLLKMENILESNYSVLAEAVQTILRVEGFDDPYTLTQRMTKGKELSRKEYLDWVSKLNSSKELKARLQSLRPTNYIGLAEKLVDDYFAG